MDPLMPHIQQRVEAEIAKAARENIIPTQRQVAITDQAEILRLDIRCVLTNQIEVIDDREPRPR
jgi:hypothetical protein